MPIENEQKYVMALHSNLEEKLLRFCKPLHIQQGYLPSEGCRVRSISVGDDIEFYFTYKHQDSFDIIEIETLIDGEDFDKLFRDCSYKLAKTRYSFSNKDEHWDIDFFHTTYSFCTPRLYFVMAECEMPEGRKEPNDIPLILVENIIAPVDFLEFTSKKLSSPSYAERKYKELIGYNV